MGKVTSRLHVGTGCVRRNCCRTCMWAPGCVLRIACGHLVASHMGYTQRLPSTEALTGVFIALLACLLHCYVICVFVNYR